MLTVNRRSPQPIKALRNLRKRLFSTFLRNITAINFWKVAQPIATVLRSPFR